MKKVFNKNLLVLALVGMTLFTSSCATILGGPISAHQKTKPADGQAPRKIRAGALVADLFCGLVPLIVDFATGAIYKPEGK